MHLVYFDESGNTGNNLDSTEQPILVVGALIVPEDCWQSLESQLENVLFWCLPGIDHTTTEIHASDLRNRSGPFEGIEKDNRLALRDGWLGLAQWHGLKFVYRSIEKSRYKAWMKGAFGPGVVVNPQIAAFVLVTRVVNEYLASQRTLGVFIVDENKEVGRDVEQSIRQLRLSNGPLRLSQIVEKGFFIDSSKSRALQLCDLCAYHARKLEEVNLGRPRKDIDKGGIELIKPLIHRGNEQTLEVLEWLKKERAGKSSK